MSNPRSALPVITYSGALSASDTEDRITSFTYTDKATGESDICTFTLDNSDRLFMLKKIPKRGDKFEAKIVLRNWEKEGSPKTVKCGTFCCDDKTYSGWPLLCTIGGTAIPEKQAFHATERTKTWENMLIREIASSICASYGLALSYDAGDIMVTSIEQSQETDSSFIKKLCENYGLNIKIYSGRITIYDAVRWESKEATKVLNIRKFGEGWTYNCTMVGVYTGATIKYTNGKEGDEYICTVGGGERILSINEKVDSLGDARIKAAARVNKENRSEETLSGDILADPAICAGMVVKVAGIAGLSGKYFIDSVTHQLEADGPYMMSLEMHKVQEAVTA